MEAVTECDEVVVDEEAVIGGFRWEFDARAGRDDWDRVDPFRCGFGDLLSFSSFVFLGERGGEAVTCSWLIL